MNKRINARGLACPQPVILTKKALEGIKDGVIEITVDNKPASENVLRFAKNSGCGAEVKKTGKNFIVRITKLSSDITKNATCEAGKGEMKAKSIVFSVLSDTIGGGSEELGKILMKAFFSTLLELKPRPQKLVFMNSGVKLTVEGSEFLDYLVELEKEGIEFLVCGTCLDYFEIKDKIKVGKVSNFLEITQTFLQADKVIRM